MKRDILAEKISKQNVEDASWVLATAIYNVRGERWIEEDIVKQKEPELEDLENSQPIYILQK